jgi:hypothetical protein
MEDVPEGPLHQNDVRSIFRKVVEPNVDSAGRKWSNIRPFEFHPLRFFWALNSLRTARAMNAIPVTAFFNLILAVSEFSILVTAF